MFSGGVKKKCFVKIGQKVTVTVTVLFLFFLLTSIFFVLYFAEGFSEPCQIFRREVFGEIVNRFAKCSILDVWQGFEYIYVIHDIIAQKTKELWALVVLLILMLLAPFVWCKGFLLKQELLKKCPYSELFWSAFSHIRTEYGKILRMRENSG